MPAAIGRARERLEAAGIPFSVDLVDLRSTSEAFARHVRQMEAGMDTLKDRMLSCRRAVATLDEILQMPASVIVRDASIQRFEYTFESLWKLLKAYLQEHEGIVCNSPKRCFREALRAGLLTVPETDLCLAMTDDRNLTAHTYLETLADAIYRRLPPYRDVALLLLARLDEQAGANPPEGATPASTAG
jgi:nucleotidyltransferase substrate binding protein (TIGR01987 family)